MSDDTKKTTPTSNVFPLKSRYDETRLNTERDALEKDYHHVAESHQYTEIRAGHSFQFDQIRYPNITDLDLFNLIEDSRKSESDVIKAAESSFDALNQSKKASAERTLEHSNKHLNHLKKQALKIQDQMDDAGNNFRVIFGVEDIVGKTTNTKFFVIAMTMSVIFYLVSEWVSLASTVQNSGDVAFVGSGGFLKALVVSAGGLLIGMMLKAIYKIPKKRSTQNKLYVVTIIIGLISAVSFAYLFPVHFLGDTTGFDDLELEAGSSFGGNPQVWLVFSQIFLQGTAISLIWQSIDYVTNHNKPEIVKSNLYLKELDESEDNYHTRIKHEEILLGHIEGFIESYFAARERFSQQFLSSYKALHLQYQSRILLSKSQFISERHLETDSYPELVVVPKEQRS